MANNRYIYALFFAGPLTHSFWGSLLAGAFALFAWSTNLFDAAKDEQIVLLCVSLLTFAVAPIIFLLATREYHEKLQASVNSWVNAAASADELHWRQQVFSEGGVESAIWHMKSGGFEPAVNVGGTPMADSFTDINGNPYGVDFGTDAHHSPIGDDHTNTH
jgi:hypothetical protein